MNAVLVIALLILSPAVLMGLLIGLLGWVQLVRAIADHIRRRRVRRRLSIVDEAYIEALRLQYGDDGIDAATERLLLDLGDDFWAAAHGIGAARLPKASQS